MAILADGLSQGSPAPPSQQELSASIAMSAQQQCLPAGPILEWLLMCTMVSSMQPWLDWRGVLSLGAKCCVSGLTHQWGLRNFF